MGKLHLLVLRERVVAFVEEGHSYRAAAARFVLPNLCFEEGTLLEAQNDFVCQTPHYRIISLYTLSR